MPAYGTTLTTRLLAQQTSAAHQDALDLEETFPHRVESVPPGFDEREPLVEHAPRRNWAMSGTGEELQLAPHACQGVSPHNKWVRRFDYIVLTALVLTSTVTVYLVCVVLTQPHDAPPNADPFHHFSYRFLVDFVLDLVFLTDFVLQFFRSFRDDDGRGRLVCELSEIQRIHLRSFWFLPDLVSSVPFDLFIGLGEALGAQANNLRFLRLIRLVRVHRARRIVLQSSWYRRLVLHVDSRKFHMVRLTLGLIMVEHWASCWWVWLGREEFLLGGDRYTWIDRLEENGFVFDRTSNWDLYVVGLYWASTVSSSVGSGDIVPANPLEAIFVAFFQILGGCLFAYAVSSLVGSYSALRANEDSRNSAVDSVNEMLRELQQEHAEVDFEKIRQFVWQAQDARAARARRRFAPGGALSQLSPQLRDDVLLAERKQWLDAVWYLRAARPRLARALARDAKWVSYAPGDLVALSSDQTLVVTRGVASVKDRVLIRGCVAGIEGCATAVQSIPGKGAQVLALNFIEGLVFESGMVERAFRADASPEEWRRLVRARLKYGLLRWARNVKATDRGIKSNGATAATVQ